MSTTDVAVCRNCGSHHVNLIHYIDRDLVRHYFYACEQCGFATPERVTLPEAADDVDWLPSHEVRF